MAGQAGQVVAACGCAGPGKAGWGMAGMVREAEVRLCEVRHGLLGQGCVRFHWHGLFWRGGVE